MCLTLEDSPPFLIVFIGIIYIGLEKEDLMVLIKFNLNRCIHPCRIMFAKTPIDIEKGSEREDYRALLGSQFGHVVLGKDLIGFLGWATDNTICFGHNFLI